MNSFNLLVNYLNSSIRNIKKNGLFTFINVIGLAISISVGLLVITFVNEVNTFDTFHKDADRVYRILNTYTSITDNEPESYASTSVQAFKKMKESVGGMEAVTFIRRSFRGDLVEGEKQIPVEGLWADEGFFKVLSFELLEGDVETALATPYSLVITEKAAIKLFGRTENVIGETLSYQDSLTYSVTGLVADPPQNSHMDFEVLASFVTLDTEMMREDATQWMRWFNMWQNYIYFKLSENQSLEEFQAKLDQISAEENEKSDRFTITLSTQPLLGIVPGLDLSNQIGQTMVSEVVIMLAGLALIVMISACFNYTNLSMAKSIRRNKEVGVRKTIGASGRQIFTQFMMEAVLISLMSLVFAFLLFFLIRPQFLTLQYLSNLVTLELGVKVILQFILLSVVAGLLGGFLPALYFSRMNPGKVFKQEKSTRAFKRVGMRKVLIVFQFVLSLGFIIGASMEYKQYKHSLSFNLGYSTENIINLRLQGNKVDIVKTELAKMPQIQDMSTSMMITSIGSTWGERVKYKDPLDSATGFYNSVDAKYIPLHGHSLIAGTNFRPQSEDSEEIQVIVNEKLLHRFGISADEPENAIGEAIKLDKELATIVGVTSDFHYSTTRAELRPFFLRLGKETDYEWINLKYQTDDVFAMMDQLEEVWKGIDPVHPLDARFYSEQIEDVYSQYLVIVKVIGFLAFLAVTIAFLGLLGMVIFTTETRLKELSIRKIFGANIPQLIMTVGRSFLVLLLISALIAVPLTYWLFEEVFFSSITYRANMGFLEIFGGVIAVLIVAVLSISSQTWSAAQRNPAEVLRNE